MSFSMLINVQHTYHVLQETTLGLTSQPDGLVFHRSCTTLFQTLIVWTEGTPPTDLTLFSFALYLKIHLISYSRFRTMSHSQRLPVYPHPYNFNASGAHYKLLHTKIWPYVSQTIVESFNCGLQRSNLASEQTRGIISLFLKPDKNPLHLLTNYRPITLLNTDYI